MYQKGTVQEHVDDMLEHTTIPVIVLVKKKRWYHTLLFQLWQAELCDQEGCLQPEMRLWMLWLVRTCSET